MVFLKDFLKKLILKNISREQKKNMNNFLRSKVLNTLREQAAKARARLHANAQFRLSLHCLQMRKKIPSNEMVYIIEYNEGFSVP